MKFLTISTIAALAVLLFPALCFAQATDPGCGISIFNGAQELIRGNVGTIVGLLVSLAGYLAFLMKSIKTGLVMIIGGVAVTAFPGLFIAFLNGTFQLFANTVPGAREFFVEYAVVECDQFIATAPNPGDFSELFGEFVGDGPDGDGVDTGLPINGISLTTPPDDLDYCTALNNNIPSNMSNPPSTFVDQSAIQRIGGRWGDNRPGHTHVGLDVYVPVGTPIHSPVDGKIVSINGCESCSGGIKVEVEGTDGHRYRFFHVQGPYGALKEEDPVVQGQPVAVAGRTGINSSDPHIHFEIKDPSLNKIDPCTVYACPSSRTGGGGFDNYNCP